MHTLIFLGRQFQAQHMSDNTPKMIPTIDTALCVHPISQLKERHKIERNLLEFAFSVVGSKRKKIPDEIAFKAFQSKRKPCLLVDGAGPLYEFVPNGKSVDRVRSAKGKCVSVVTQAPLGDLDVQ